MRDWISTISPDVIAKAADRPAPGSPCPQTLTNRAGFVTTASGERDRCSSDAPYDRSVGTRGTPQPVARISLGEMSTQSDHSLSAHFVVQRRTMHQHHWHETSVIAAAQFVLQLFR
jgi:GrpB-like predicted nucleotidyltransferase (UPF0157 family)